MLFKKLVSSAAAIPKPVFLIRNDGCLMPQTFRLSVAKSVGQGLHAWVMWLIIQLTTCTQSFKILWVAYSCDSLLLLPNGTLLNLQASDKLINKDLSPYDFANEVSKICNCAQWNYTLKLSGSGPLFSLTGGNITVLPLKKKSPSLSWSWPLMMSWQQYGNGLNCLFVEYFFYFRANVLYMTLGFPESLLSEDYLKWSGLAPKPRCFLLGEAKSKETQWLIWH